MMNKEKAREVAHRSASFLCIAYADGTDHYNRRLYAATSQRQQSNPFRVSEQL